MRKANGPVYVKLTRPEGYEDACEQIVIEDAEIHPGFMPEPATEEVERLREEVRAMSEILINLLSEERGPAPFPSIRALMEARDGEGHDQ